VRAGSDDSTSGGVVLNVVKYHLHPKFGINSAQTQNIKDYDVAVLEVHSFNCITFITLKFINLPTAERIFSIRQKHQQNRPGEINFRLFHQFLRHGSSGDGFRMGTNLGTSFFLSSSTAD